MPNKKTKAETREIKKRKKKKMPVSGKSVFKIKEIISSKKPRIKQK